jgi:hypothetical protein
MKSKLLLSGRISRSTEFKLPLPAPSLIKAGSIVLRVNPERWKKSGAKTPAIRFRVSHRLGKQRISGVFHDPETLVKDAKNWAKLLDSDGCPRSATAIKEQRRQAMLFNECHELLASHRLDPVSACRFIARLLEVMDLEGIEKLTAVYLPLLRKCRPLFVHAGVASYRQFLFKNGKPETKNEKRKDKCLELFDARFGGTQYHFVTVEQIRAFLKDSTSSADMQNKFLYCLRAHFQWARDDKESLPARMETVCDLVEGRKPDKAEPEIYPVRAFAWLAALAVDREMVLALTLVGQHFVRQEEALKLRGEHFHRDYAGTPDEIIIPSDVAKTGTQREIPIRSQFRPLYKMLLPPYGPIFQSKQPFSRIQRLATILGIQREKNGFRHSCVSYAIGAGMPRRKAARLAGHDLQTQGAFYYVQVDPREATKYWRIIFNNGRVVQLPHYRRVNFTRQFSKWKNVCAPNAAQMEPATIEAVTKAEID